MKPHRQEDGIFYSFRSLRRPLRGLEPSGPKGMAPPTAGFWPFSYPDSRPKYASPRTSRPPAYVGNSGVFLKAGTGARPALFP